MKSRAELEEEIKKKRRWEWILTFLAIFFIFVSPFLLNLLIGEVVGDTFSAAYEPMAEKAAEAETQEELEEAWEEAENSPAMQRHRQVSMLISVVGNVSWAIGGLCFIVGVAFWIQRRGLEKQLEKTTNRIE